MPNIGQSPPANRVSDADLRSMCQDERAQAAAGGQMISALRLAPTMPQDTLTTTSGQPLTDSNGKPLTTN